MLYSELQKKHALRSGEIVIEIDNEHHDIKNRVTASDVHDPFNPDKLRMDAHVTIAGNRHLYFPPVGARSFNSDIGKEPQNFIRTRDVLIRRGLKTRFMLDEALQGIEMIPGERLHLDMNAKTCRVTDAIFDPENDEIYHKLRRIGSEIHGHSRIFMPGPYFEANFSNDLHALWTWAYHMRQIMDGDAEHNAGDERHKGCATSGPRTCRPVQNVDHMPTMREIARSKQALVIRYQYANAEREKAWQEMRKQEDPDYVRQDGNQTVLTPWLAGMAVAETD